MSLASPAPDLDSAHDPYAPLRIANFRWFVISILTMAMGAQIQGVVVAWQMYDVTGDPLALGLVGLAEAAPFVAFALYAGHVADVRDRRRVALLSLVLLFVCAGVLAAASALYFPAGGAHARGRVAIKHLRHRGSAAVQARAQRRRVLSTGFFDRRRRLVHSTVVSARAPAAVILRRHAAAGRQAHAAHRYHEQRSKVRSHAHPPWLDRHRSGIGPGSFSSSGVAHMSIDNRDVTSATELAAIISAQTVGARVVFGVVRRGATLVLPLSVADRPLTAKTAS